MFFSGSFRACFFREEGGESTSRVQGIMVDFDSAMSQVAAVSGVFYFIINTGATGSNLDEKRVLH